MISRRGIELTALAASFRAANWELSATAAHASATLPDPAENQVFSSGTSVANPLLRRSMPKRLLSAGVTNPTINAVGESESEMRLFESQEAQKA